MEHCKEALRWFFKEGRKQSGTGVSPVRSRSDVPHGRDARATTTISDVPTLGAADPGKTDCERAAAHRRVCQQLLAMALG